MLSPERSPFREGVAAVLLYALLIEWLRPLLDMAEWSGVYRIGPFLLAFALFVAVDWSRLPPWIGWPIKLLVCIGMVGYLFDAATFPNPAWLARHFELTLKDAVAIADADYGAFSGENRTLLFLLGWSMMISVIYASVVERQHALWFVAATLLYLLGLQLWPGVNTSGAIIRTVWFGFVLMGLLQFSRLESRFALRRRLAGWPIGWLVSVPLLLAAVVAAGLWLPPQQRTGVMKPLDTGELMARLGSWSPIAGGGAAPVSVIDASAQETSGPNDVALTGYGEDDTVLGGPVRPDDSVAFIARTERSTYWRGETKTFYTGKGWENGDVVAGERRIEPQPRATDSIVQEVTVLDPRAAGRLFAGGTIEKVEAIATRSGKPLPPEEVLTGGDGAYVVSSPDPRDPVAFYRLQVSVPRTDAGWDVSPAAALGEGAPADAEWAGPDRETFAAELQLPATLPTRVQALAETIASGLTSDYARASAIETFLKSNYAYRMDVAELPAGADDFVDSFLFESKEGYCDYFSTSMVVLLRSAGIPARWVKGFTPGEAIEDAGGRSEDGMTLVQVLNRNAHSWAEAYIEGRGWVAFDPTPSAAASAAPESVVASLAPVAAGAAGNAAGAASAAGAAEVSAGRPWDAALTNVRAWLEQQPASRLALIAAGALLLLVPPLLYALLRRRPTAVAFAPHGGPYSHEYARGRRSASTRAFDRLWRRLFAKLGRKHPGLTVREYVDALPLAEPDKREALRDFVRQYEAVRYGGAPAPRSSRRSAKEFWRRIGRT
ncbi:DUF4129 domain-containing transglutaminase family protein [Paenibacillus flagellatus]|uniref:Transglutaminase-like domain-containing protein n=1 Tax=Paenibacillus flagellatus TaxID=2211139 RepID=A0A2V5JVB5_9BACL|nr:transglutaminase domain-containing protein [Paenibacillus flagellatus]PYI50629.1 hypothetical protein DLM86_28060 [Paenibacillus flagellatus]